MKPSEKLKILWAIDAFDDLKEIEENIVMLLRGFANRTSIEIRPVYVMGPKQLGMPIQVKEPWNHHLETKARGVLSDKIKKWTVPSFTEPVVLLESRASLRAAVESLIKFGQKDDYDFIVTGSHGRRGLNRVFLGSFAEELIFRSPIPVLLVGKNAKEIEAKANILLADDLSEPDSSLFPKVFGLASKLNAGIHLFTAAPKATQQTINSEIYLLWGGWVPFTTLVDEEISRLRKVGEGLVAKATASGILCDLTIGDFTYSAAESILSRAEELKPNFLVIQARGGPLENVLLGAVSRQLIREAPCPVLVFHTKN